MSQDCSQKFLPTQDGFSHLCCCHDMRSVGPYGRHLQMGLVNVAEAIPFSFIKGNFSMRFLPTESSFSKPGTDFPKPLLGFCCLPLLPLFLSLKRRVYFSFSLKLSLIGLLKPVYIVRAMEIYVCKLMPIIFMA